MIVKLSDYTTDLERGSILRCSGKYPYEDIVDFMLVEHNDGEASYALMVVSGYKSGLIYAVLPHESIPLTNDGYAVSINWLRSNWEKWGYFECPWQEVYLLKKEPPLNFDS